MLRHSRLLRAIVPGSCRAMRTMHTATAPIPDGNGRRWDWGRPAETPTCGHQQPVKPVKPVKPVLSVLLSCSHRPCPVRRGSPSAPSQLLRPIFTFRGSCPCHFAPTGLQAGPWPCRAVPAPALSPPPSPPPSVPCPHLIAPLILAPLRNRLDDVPFRLNFFLGGRAAWQSIKQVRATTHTHPGTYTVHTHPHRHSSRTKPAQCRPFPL